MTLDELYCLKGKYHAQLELAQEGLRQINGQINQILAQQLPKTELTGKADKKKKEPASEPQPL